MLWVSLRPGWDVALSSSGLQDRMKYWVCSAPWTKGPDSLSTPQLNEQGSNVPSTPSLCWISNGSVGQCFIFHFACLSFLNFSLSLNQGSPGHTSVTWTQFSTVERTHQVVLLSLRGWYYGTFYLLGASDASCPLYKWTSERCDWQKHTVSSPVWLAALSGPHRSFFPLTDSGALFGLNGAVMA